MAPPEPQTLTADEVRRLCGEISDAAVSEILALGATTADIERAMADESDGDGMVRPVSGPAGAVARILADERGWREPPEAGR